MCAWSHECRPLNVLGATFFGPQVPSRGVVEKEDGGALCSHPQDGRLV